MYKCTTPFIKCDYNLKLNKVSELYDFLNKTVTTLKICSFYVVGCDSLNKTATSTTYYGYKKLSESSVDQNVTHNYKCLHRQPHFIYDALLPIKTHYKTFHILNNYC